MFMCVWLCVCGCAMVSRAALLGVVCGAAISVKWYVGDDGAE